MANKHFSVDELAAIEKSVRQAESNISGEIVPVFIEKCSTYLVAFYRAGVFMGLLTLAVMVVINYAMGSLWAATYLNALWYFIIPLTIGLLTALGVYCLPNLQRKLVGESRLWEMAYHKANAFFLREEVFNTDQRTGIMIMIAFFEHRVIVKADKGISSVVPQEDWEEVVALIIRHIKKGETAIGIIKGVERCAQILEAHQFLIAPDDTNELPNRLRVE